MKRERCRVPFSFVMVLCFLNIPEASIEALILVAGNPVFFSIILDNCGLDQKIVSNDLVGPSVLKKLQD